ncbi:hypothetical protein [Bacillus sp. N1-1]|uniref:hypothetical protein n=1 Tax=Bacillus sp. N1-1 TaxID=2682541 RepID=UPI001319B62F|nr:hypothetical protein [Bacillus sp. N1-1]QHA90174.1 hypothetical protein GNK04_01095 [Bacillus sp. N1-1]
MDKYSRSKYNGVNKLIGVIDMATIYPSLDTESVSEKDLKLNEKPQSISELRKMLAIKTAPGHSLVQLYNRGQ